jgi:hypothetical protein
MAMAVTIRVRLRKGHAHQTAHTPLACGSLRWCWHCGGTGTATTTTSTSTTTSQCAHPQPRCRRRLARSTRRRCRCRQRWRARGLAASCAPRAIARAACAAPITPVFPRLEPDAVRVVRSLAAAALHHKLARVCALARAHYRARREQGAGAALRLRRLGRRHRLLLFCARVAEPLVVTGHDEVVIDVQRHANAARVKPALTPVAADHRPASPRLAAHAVHLLLLLGGALRLDCARSVRRTLRNQHACRCGATVPLRRVARSGEDQPRRRRRRRGGLLGSAAFRLHRDHALSAAGKKLLRQ